MKTVIGWVEEQYGLEHIETIMKLNDHKSFYGIMDEYANYKSKIIAERVREDCAENASIRTDFEDYPKSHWIDKNSILETEIIIKP